jgi:hypothetical protein
MHRRVAVNVPQEITEKIQNIFFSPWKCVAWCSHTICHTVGLAQTVTVPYVLKTDILLFGQRHLDGWNAERRSTPICCLV